MTPLQRRISFAAVPTLLAIGFALVKPAWLAAAPQMKAEDDKKDGGGVAFSFGSNGPGVEIQQPTRGRIAETVHAAATIKSAGEVSVGAPFEGRVSELCVDEGAAVVESDVIFRLDPIEYDDKKREAELELARKQAALLEADAELKEAEHKYTDSKNEPSTVVEARLKIRSSELARDRASAELENSEAKLARAREMLAQNVGKQEDVDTAVAEKRVQSIALRIADEDLRLAKETLDFRLRTWVDDKATAEKAFDTAATHVGRAKADLRAAEVALERAIRDRGRCDVRTPIAGVVTQRNVNEGSLVGRADGRTADTTHYIVSDMSRMYAYADVDESDVVKVQPKQVARVRVNALGDDVRLAGRVIDVANRAQVKTNDETKSFRVRVLISPADDRLRPDMSANVDVETKTTADDALRLPLQAVMHKPKKDLPPEAIAAGEREKAKQTAAAKTDGAPTKAERSDDNVDCVFVFSGDSVSLRVIGLGASDGEYVEVKWGVSEGDWIVLGPYRVLETLKPGDHVKATKKEPPKPDVVPAASATATSAPVTSR
jgi:HlyD family secretion protein